MALTNRQIDRYSRQLIVDKFGGIAQERLLASRLLLVAGAPDEQTVLAYLVGAGVGKIDLAIDPDVAARESVISGMRDLNSDSVVTVRTECAPVAAEFDLALAIISDIATLARTRDLCERPFHSAIVFARVDAPARLAVIPARPPCPRCAGIGDLLGPLDARAANADFLAMVAALEAIKLLARYDPPPKPTLIEFDGYRSSRRIIEPLAAIPCSCDPLIAPTPPR